MGDDPAPQGESRPDVGRILLSGVAVLVCVGGLVMAIACLASTDEKNFPRCFSAAMCLVAAAIACSALLKAHRRR